MVQNAITTTFFDESRRLSWSNPTTAFPLSTSLNQLDHRLLLGGSRVCCSSGAALTRRGGRSSREHERVNWGVVEAQPRGAPTLTTGTHPKMLTRKQRWRRTRTRKNAWGNLPPEVLDAMLAGGGGMPKSVSWDHSYAAGLKIRADAAAEVARRAAKEDSRLKAAAAAAAVRGGPIPRSVSCSSLAPKRTLFPRSNSKDELGTRPRRGSGPPTGRHIGRDMLPHRRGVSFDTQVRGRFGGLSCAVLLTGCCCRGSSRP